MNLSVFLLHYYLPAILFRYNTVLCPVQGLSETV